MNFFFNACGMWIAGFACTDISNLNVHQGQHATACADGKGKTGGTWHGNRQYSKSWQPMFEFYENVAALKKGSCRFLPIAINRPNRGN